MPLHDWSQTDAGVFHAFHSAWLIHLSEALNGGILPNGYYALPEQHAGRSIPDILTLHTGDSGSNLPVPDGGLAVAEAPPRTSQKISLAPTARSRRRTLAIRHVSGHRIVALVEIVSPANKDRARHVADFAEKIASALEAGVHVLLIDLLPPGRHDPAGMHGAVWSRLDDQEVGSIMNPAKPLMVASYDAGPDVEAYLEPLAVGDALPEMPLFLQPERYALAPLGPTYDAAFRGLPSVYRDALSRRDG